MTSPRTAMRIRGLFRTLMIEAIGVVPLASKLRDSSKELKGLIVFEISIAIACLLYL